MKTYLLAIDEGTTGTTAVIMDEALQLIAEASIDFPQHFPQPGWVEHDPNEIWKAVSESVSQALKKADLKGSAIAAIGITNQRETLVFWDKLTGKTLSNAIVWQDRRTAELCESLKSQSLEKVFSKATGLLLDPYFSGTKAAWALANWPNVKKAEKDGRLAVGTIDSYLISKLTGNSRHVTEPSNASRTLAFHLEKRAFDLGLCAALGVPLSIWPEVIPSNGAFGTTKGLNFLPDGIPITGALGDQQAALLGQACTRPGRAKCTYGTGAFLLMNTGSTPVYSKHRLLTTIAWALGDLKDDKNITYALEGSTFVAGAAVQWFRDGLGLIEKASDIEALAATVETSEGVTFVPALTGLGAPHWSPDSTGLFTGITRGTKKSHMARAVLEGIAFQISDLLAAMQQDIGRPLESLNVDGGAAENNMLMQFQADILGVKLKRPRYIETTSLGAIFAAGLGAGVWTDLAEVEKSWKLGREFVPNFSPTERGNEINRWRNAVARALLRP
ncbi:MAG: glycerol kinase GlpK [Cryobacterium sp.]|nr:glycerol kinase GlpK [Oligoflexia bacterium]